MELMEGRRARRLLKKNISSALKTVNVAKVYKPHQILDSEATFQSVVGDHSHHSQLFKAVLLNYEYITTSEKVAKVSDLIAKPERMRKGVDDRDRAAYVLNPIADSYKALGGFSAREVGVDIFDRKVWPLYGIYEAVRDASGFTSSDSGPSGRQQSEYDGTYAKLIPEQPVCADRIRPFGRISLTQRCANARLVPILGLIAGGMIFGGCELLSRGRYVWGWLAVLGSIALMGWLVYVA